MPGIRQVKTTFTAGQVSRALLGRGDLQAYQNGALTLHNVFIQPTGGVTRRAGLRYIDTASGDGRLISFEFNTEQVYLLVLTDGRIAVYNNDALTATLDAPWSQDQISSVAWTQSADTLLLTHPDVPPKKLTRNAGGTWSIADWAYIADGNIIRQPYFKFADPEVMLTASATTGPITLTSSVDVFEAGHNGTRLRVGGQEVLITAFDSPTVVTATVIQTLAGTTATGDWQEQAFSPVRGWPVTVAFHQDRLVVGGSRALPNRLWFSQSGDLFNFDLGAGLEDEAIEFSILSDQVNAIRGIFSGRDFQVFTSGAEWMVSGAPLTPATVQILRQTRIGSVVERYIPPVDVDGATLFVARNGEQIQEFLFNNIEAAYQVTDLTIISRQLLPTPVDQSFDQKRRLLFVVRADGKFLTLTVYRTEAVEAWTQHDTGGLAKSVAVVGNDVYLLIGRGDAFTIEKFDDALNLDSALTGSVTTPTATWAGLDYLEGQTVSIVADGIVQDSQAVAGGIVTLAQPASSVEIGLPYMHIIEPLPPNAVDGGGIGRVVRLSKAVFRIENTAALRLDTGRGLQDIALRRLSGEPVLDAPPPRVSGDIYVGALGWQDRTDLPLWRIEQDAPLPFTLLSVLTELVVNS
jgi:hypothetical protein